MKWGGHLTLTHWSDPDKIYAKELMNTPPTSDASSNLPESPDLLAEKEKKAEKIPPKKKRGAEGAEPELATLIVRRACANRHLLWVAVKGRENENPALLRVRNGAFYRMGELVEGVLEPGASEWVPVAQRTTGGIRRGGK